MLSAFVVRLADVDTKLLLETDGSKITVRAVRKQHFDKIDFNHKSGSSVKFCKNINTITQLTNWKCIR